MRDLINALLGYSHVDAKALWFQSTDLSQIVIELDQK